MIKKNMKSDDKKSKTLNHYKNLFDMCHNIIKTSNGAIKLRCSRLMKSIIDKDEKIRRLENHHLKFKNAVVSHHKTYIEKNKDEEMAFLNAVNKLDFDGPSFDEVLETQMKEVKKNRGKTSELNKENISNYNNIGNSTISPIHFNSKYPPNFTFSSTKRNTNDTNVSRNMSTMSYALSGIVSPISSSINTSINSHNGNTTKQQDLIRFTTTHSLKKYSALKSKTKRNKCNLCSTQDSKTVMFKCTLCRVFIHEQCRNIDTVCIPLISTKLNITVNSSRCLSLSDLCVHDSCPVVPNSFLAIMNHLHRFGLSTEHLYTVEGRDKEVRELCNRLLEGRSKMLIEADIKVVSNAFLMLLKCVKEPLLSTSVVKKMRSFMNGGGDVDLQAVAVCLMELDAEVKDTLIYLLIHFKIICGSSTCKFNAKRLANTFSPIISQSSYDLEAGQVINMLIELDILFYDTYFVIDKDFFGQYFKQL